MKLNDSNKTYFSVSSGQTFRTKVETKIDGHVQVIQMKDLDASYTRVVGEPALVYENEVSDNQILKKGDILFLSKGNNNKAFVFDEDYQAVAVSLFFVIRADVTELLPEYLTWFLNSKDTQKLLKSSREGSTVASIKKVTLEKLKVPIPELKEQRLIAKIYTLNRQEQKLVTDITEKRNILIDTILKNKVKI